MDDDRDLDDAFIEEEEHLGPLAAGEEGESESETSIDEPEPQVGEPEPQVDEPEAEVDEPEDLSYWLAHYFTRGRYGGMVVMAVKFPPHWPKERAEKAAQDVQRGDKYAIKEFPVVVKKSEPPKEPPCTPENDDSDWRVSYRVFKNPTTMAARQVQLNFSNVFNEEEVTAEAHRAVANHSDYVTNSLMIEKVSSMQSRKDDLITALFREEELYPILQDKDWLRKMTGSDTPTPTDPKRKRGASSESSASAAKRRSLRLYDKEKAPLSKEDAEPVPGTSRAEPVPGTSRAEAEVQTDAGLSGTQEQPVSPKASTSKGGKQTPKERFKGKVFPQRCPDCKKGFRTLSLLKSHRAQCVKCPTCGEWRDQRHADRCKNYKLCNVCDRWLAPSHKCKGKKVLKGKQIHCSYCHRAINESHMYGHFQAIHGLKWSKGAYPECMPEEEYQAQERLKILAQEEKKELEELRSARQRQTEAVKMAEDECLRLEAENQKLNQEKKALEQTKLQAEKEAEKAIHKRDEQLQEVVELIKSKEAEIKEKEEQLREATAAAAAAVAAAAAAAEDDAAAAAAAAAAEEDVEAKLEPDDEEDEIKIEPDVDNYYDPGEGLSSEDMEIMSDDTFWFPLPSFSEAKKNRPTEKEVEKVLSIVPALVGDTIISAMPDTVLTGKPELVHMYLEAGRLPNWTVIWFVRVLRTINNRSSDASLFLKAMHMIEAYRQKRFYG